MGIENLDLIISRLREHKKGAVLPSVSDIALMNGSPFKILISTVISLRTRDKVTLEASLRLFAKASDPSSLAALDAAEIEKLIYPAGFYKRKAVQIKEISRIIAVEYNSIVPKSVEQLTGLPGVGRKTANLTLGLGYGISALCVDTHVHRIANRMGWVTTKTPEKTEYALTAVLPEKYWIEINELLVIYGQTVCTPQSPRCSSCVFSSFCPKKGVEKSR